jgi:uncharacterized protein involved in outer membrane biogenesis
LCLLFLLWVLLVIYVEWKKDSLLEKARSEISARIGGTLHIGHLDISLFRHFPAVTVSMTDVSLKDSAWQRHGHDLLQADRLYISFSPVQSLLHGRVELGKVFLEKATIYLFTDSSGYTNTYLLKPQNPPGSEASAGEPSNGGFPTVILSDVRFVLDRQDRHKFFDLDVRQLSAVIDRKDRELSFDVNAIIEAKSFAFNTEKGSFIRGKRLSGHFALTYNLASKILQADKARLDIDGYPFVFSGRFFPTVKPDPFFLTIDVGRIPFRAAAALLTPHLQEKLDVYNVDKPVSIHAQLDAGAADEPEPQIQVRLRLDNGTVQTPVGKFEDASFTGVFINEWAHGQGRNDENSGIRFTGFSGRFGGVSLHADSLVITDLKHPQLRCDLHSKFDIATLNDLYGSEALQFRSGTCAMDLVYKGPMSENDTAGATVNGNLDLDSAAIVYLPFQFSLTNGTGRVMFRDQDMVIDHLQAKAGNTRVQIKGVAKNLIALIDHNSENVSMDWTLTTAHLAVEDFIALAGRMSTASSRRKAAGGPSTGGQPSGTPAFGAVAARIDEFLKAGTIQLHLDASGISYGDFSGAHAKATLAFQGKEIRLSKMSVEQNSGTMDLKATLSRGSEGDVSPLTMESHLERVDLPGLFKSFDDFGLKAITAHNLKGKMTADIKMDGLLTAKARIVPNSFKGTVDFSIVDGQLIDFEPMEKIHETVLKKRDMSEIHFGPLENRLDIDSTTIRLHRMEIQSTAFTVFAEGTYDLKTGTDMSLQVPLSNLKSRADDAPPESRGNDSKAGPSLRLRAKTGPDGKLKVSWDPFRKALKKAKKA